MDEPTYAFRPSINRPERTYSLTGDELVWSESGVEGRLPFTAIRRVRLYGSPALVNRFLGGVVAPGFARCVIQPVRGSAHILSSNHFVRLGVFEDRSPSYEPFVASLLRRAAAASPGSAFVAGMPWGLWGLWAAVLVLTAVIGLFAAVVALTILAGAKRDLFTAVFALVFSLGCGFSAVRMTRMLGAQRPRTFDPRG